MPLLKQCPRSWKPRTRPQAHAKKNGLWGKNRVRGRPRQLSNFVTSTLTTNHPGWQLRLSGSYHSRCFFKGELEPYLREGLVGGKVAQMEVELWATGHHGGTEGHATLAGCLVVVLFFPLNITHKGPQLPVQEPGWRLSDKSHHSTPLIWLPLEQKILEEHAVRFLPYHDYISPSFVWQKRVVAEQLVQFPLKFLQQ